MQDKQTFGIAVVVYRYNRNYMSSFKCLTIILFICTVATVLLHKMALGHNQCLRLPPFYLLYISRIFTICMYTMYSQDKQHFKYLGQG